MILRRIGLTTLLVCMAVAARGAAPPAAPTEPLPKEALRRLGTMRFRQATLEGDVTGLAFSADGKTLASAWDGAVRLWDTKTGEQRATFRSPKGWVSAAALSPDGKQLAIASGAS